MSTVHIKYVGRAAGENILLLNWSPSSEGYLSSTHLAILIQIDEIYLFLNRSN